MLIKVQMVCKYDKNHGNGAEMNERAQSTGPGLRRQGPSLSLVCGVWLWTHQVSPEPAVPYLVR